MNKNLMAKFVVIVVLVLLAGWTLYPPSKTLKPGIDLAGGTSLIYEIDTYGMTEEEKTDLAQRMITVLRRRIDPSNIQNLVWRPQGNSRFEIQMPLASAEAREKRTNYETAETELLAKNISRAKVMQALKKSAEDRAVLFEQYAQNDADKMQILETLTDAYDRRTSLQEERDTAYEQLTQQQQKLADAGITIDDTMQEQLADLAGLDEDTLFERMIEFADTNDKITLLVEYVQIYTRWAEAADKLTEVTPEYTDAFNAIDGLNLTIEQVNLALELPEKSKQRTAGIESLKQEFPDRAEQIDNIVAAFDAYRTFRGRLDDPGDLKRMLKGAGILEFRILPTLGNAIVDSDLMQEYVKKLTEKGPEYASDNEYKWYEIESPDSWVAFDEQENPSVTGQFGDKSYVLASNKSEEIMLHTVAGSGDWKLERSYPTTTDMGRAAIGFSMDERGTRLFGSITTNNVGRPLCILLDSIAVSAPNIEEPITGGQGVIRGNFSKTEIDDMINKLNAGSLPARLIEQPISENTIGPSIGADNRDQGIRAGVIGLIAVVACMAGYYFLAGAVADTALMLNILFILAIMAGLHATFTLPGIAGIILTIGMSVDANVLIYERIREEQLKGSSLRVSIANGYQRAFWTIFDANLTTFLTAAILYWRASEEIRGFALVLMLGIVSSLFTAMFVTRIVFDYLLSKQVIKEHLMMLRLVHNTNINWMRARPVFMTISGTLIVLGLVVFFTRDSERSNKYDIEFTGGTSVQINLNESAALSRSDVEQKIRAFLPAANVYSIGETGSQYEITTTQTNKTSVTVTAAGQSGLTAEQVTARILEAQKKYADDLRNLTVTADSGSTGSFVISTSQMSRSLIQDVLSAALPDAQISVPVIEEVVNNAVLSAFSDELEIQQDLRPDIVSAREINEEVLDNNPELADFFGGVMILFRLGRETTIDDLQRRMSDLQFRTDTRDLESYDYQIFAEDTSLTSDSPAQNFIYASAMPDAGTRQYDEDEWTRYTENEQTKVLAAGSLDDSLPRVRQFDPSVGSEQKTRALIAIILSLIGIVAYIWVRFGNFRYGIAAIIALIHDVCITLGAITACTYIAGTSIGDLLLIGDFKIDLAMIAAFLTLIGYSLNDTIVVFDRIRENTSKTKQLTAQAITDSINQTIPRTIMTSFTTFVVVFIMYVFGGAGLRGFNFAMCFGIIIGTYSSIAIAAPILLIGSKIKLTGKEKKA